MKNKSVRIGVVAPSCRIDDALPGKLTALADSLFPGRISLTFHPQCFLSSGHFAGTDEERLGAFVDFANDESFSALWLARGGYGSGRIATRALDRLSDSARHKAYLGYSDAGALLGTLYSVGYQRLFHAPMPADLLRRGGERAIERVLAFLVDDDPKGIEPTASPQARTAAFNITILSHLIGTPSEPDLSDHVLMLEEVAEQMYRIDRALGHITSAPNIRKVAGIKLGRCSAVPENDPDFGETDDQVARHWCDVSGIAYLGRADIGHDVENKIVPYGCLR